MKFIKCGEKNGFTLIELLIVIAIILILIAIALPNFLDAQIRAKVVKAKGEQRSIATAMESYFIDRQTYTHDCKKQYIGCIQLTSPVRYIKELPLNAFGLLFDNDGDPETFLNQEIPFYPMATGINPKTRDKCCTPYPPGSGRTSPPFREVYMIYSSGPSDLEPGGPTNQWPLDGNSPQRVWQLYAATNGTKSFGGIITTGGVTLQRPVHANLRATHF